MTFNQTWGPADPDAVGNMENGEPPDPGSYDVALIEASAFTSKKGEDWIALKWQIVGTDHDWTSLLGFRSQAAANFAKREIRELGIDVDAVNSLEELDGELRRLAGTYYTVEVIQNGQYRNTYVRGRPAAGDIPTPGAVPAGGETDTDDVPF